MTQYPNESTGLADRAHAHPVAALHDQLTQIVTAASQLRTILAPVDDPDNRFGETR